jgi:hypothetical protein
LQNFGYIGHVHVRLTGAFRGLPGRSWLFSQDVKASHVLRESYAPPLQSNFRVSAVLRFQRKAQRSHWASIPETTYGSQK